jgi:hypothetical protein
MPNAITTCTSNANCTPPNSSCDPARNGCRSPTAAVCYDNAGCAVGEQCYPPTTGYEQLGKFNLPASPGSPTIVKVDLTYLASAAIAPTWTLIQGTGQYVGPPPTTVGQGASAQSVQSSAVVNLGTGTIYVQVQNGGQNVNTTDTYTLTVEVTQDPDEGVARNDVASSATAITSSGTLGAKHIVASNDFDWYKLTRPATPNANSLVLIDCTASSSAPYSLTVQYWSETVQTCDHTAANPGCNQGNPCADTNKCLQLVIQRPDPDDANADPQVGGRAPNNLHTQLPILNSANAWVRVASNPSTTLPIPGYDNESVNPYTMAFTFKDEPDPGDQPNPADNSFIGRPSEKDFSIGDYHPNFRAGAATVDGVTHDTSGSATGYITYDGDQDFFKWTPSAALPAGGLSITITYGASEVDLRATLQRDDNGVAGEASGNDFCGTCGDPGQTCNAARATCHESAINITVPIAGGCSHTESTSANDITLWVNDVDSNDWDETQAYTITWQYIAGCDGPGAGCPAGAGAACAGH